LSTVRRSTDKLETHGSLVSTGWLAGHLDTAGLRILDASWHLPDTGRDARAEYAVGHIPGALFFDIDEVSDRKSPLPHMLPAEKDFARAVGAFGIGNDDTVVVYDAGTVHAAARAWWMFRVFGHERIAVLNGGLGAWCAEERPIETAVPTPTSKPYTARLRPKLLADRAAVMAASENGAVRLLDARGPDRFSGNAPEPRPEVASGHIPNSRNLHYARLYDEEERLKPPDELRRLFAEAGATLETPVIATCGSGVSACSIALALAWLGHERWRVYDGSWAEWGSDPALPKATGTQ